MSFNPGCASAVDDKNVFVPEETNRVELETEEVLCPQNSQDGKSPTTSIKVAVYTMIEEDDGVGQMLRKELQQDPRVHFAAYRIPHRQEALLKLRFHVDKNVDPQLVLHDAIDRLVNRINAVSTSLQPPKL